MTPESLPELIEANPSVAVAVLQRLGTTPASSATAAVFVDVLLTAPLTLHSLEVVNQLIDEADTPTTPMVAASSAASTAAAASASAAAVASPPSVLGADFLPRYVAHCIQCCDRISDKYQQSRLVRLVCVFVSSLLARQLLRVADVAIELQAFCLGFGRLKEASSLYRLLKLEQ